MNLSELRPAEGSKHSDNFRRGRGHGSGNGKTAGLNSDKFITCTSLQLIKLLLL